MDIWTKTTWYLTALATCNKLLQTTTIFDKLIRENEPILAFFGHANNQNYRFWGTKHVQFDQKVVI